QAYVIRRPRESRDFPCPLPDACRYASRGAEESQAAPALINKYRLKRMGDNGGAQVCCDVPFACPHAGNQRHRRTTGGLPPGATAAGGTGGGRTPPSRRRNIATAGGFTGNAPRSGVPQCRGDLAVGTPLLSGPVRT